MKSAKVTRVLLRLAAVVTGLAIRLPNFVGISCESVSSHYKHDVARKSQTGGNR